LLFSLWGGEGILPGGEKRGSVGGEARAAKKEKGLLEHGGWEKKKNYPSEGGSSLFPEEELKRGK